MIRTPSSGPPPTIADGGTEEDELVGEGDEDDEEYLEDGDAPYTGGIDEGVHDSGTPS